MKNSQWLLMALLAARLQTADAQVPATDAQLQKYPLDSSNTQVSFAIEHLGFQWMTARFADIQGQYVIERRGGPCRVNVSVGMASLDSSQPRWNERLRSAEWLDVERYPRMSATLYLSERGGSAQATAGGEESTYHPHGIMLAGQQATATGELTLHGVTHPIALQVTFPGCDSSGTCRFTAHGRIRRSEYGLPHSFWSGGDQVDISISGALAGAVSNSVGSDHVAVSH